MNDSQVYLFTLYLFIRWGLKTEAGSKYSDFTRAASASECRIRKTLHQKIIFYYFHYQYFTKSIDRNELRICS